MMKNISMGMIFSALTMVGSYTAHAQHDHHPKHNMLLYGTEEVFADHIVYKVPHNYQVILRVDFNSGVKQAYLDAKDRHPGDTFIFLLDSMNIGKIAEAERISGTILRRGSLDQEEIIQENVVLDREHFKVLYFDEIPLSLGNGPATGHLPVREASVNNGTSKRFEALSAENSCKAICRPISLGSDDCQAYCRTGETPVCQTRGQGAGCVAACFCRGRR